MSGYKLAGKRMRNKHIVNTFVASGKKHKITMDINRSREMKMQHKHTSIKCDSVLHKLDNIRLGHCFKILWNI